MYRINSKLQGKAEQSAYIKAELNKIFGEGGYPYEYIDKLEDIKLKARVKIARIAPCTVTLLVIQAVRGTANMRESAN